MVEANLGWRIKGGIGADANDWNAGAHEAFSVIDNSVNRIGSQHVVDNFKRGL